MEASIKSGADALGFIFGYDASPRNLPFEKLEELTQDIPPYVSVVVVSPSSNPELARVIEQIKPSFLQLYSENGHRPSFRTNVIETVHMCGDRDSLISRCNVLSRSCRGILLDSAMMEKKDQSKTYGGTGTTSDWNLCRDVRDSLHPFPVILAGGLTEENVSYAICSVKPFAVDVSSGVESAPGIKDEIKVRKFVQNAKAA